VIVSSSKTIYLVLEMHMYICNARHVSCQSELPFSQEVIAKALDNKVME
jgi:hypothetical protein